MGRLLGRHPVCLGGRKTWEGTAASICATLVGWWLASACCAALGGAGSDGGTAGGLRWGEAGARAALQLAAATALSSLLEAATTQLDNLFVPLHYFTLLCCGSALWRPV